MEQDKGKDKSIIGMALFNMVKGIPYPSASMKPEMWV